MAIAAPERGEAPAQGVPDEFDLRVHPALSFYDRSLRPRQDEVGEVLFQVGELPFRRPERSERNLEKSCPVLDRRVDGGGN